MILRPSRLPHALSLALVAGVLSASAPVAAQQVPIRDAALKGDLARVQKLLKAKPGLLKAKESNGSVCMGAYSGKLPVVQALVAAGGKVNEKDFDGSTPLHHAAAAASAPITQFLISRGANAKAAKWNGWTPLHEAAASGSTEVANLLLAKGARVNATAGSKGETPLAVAVKYRNSGMVSLLRKKGAK